MIDFHTHLLPAVDDGSKSVSESETLLEMLYAQGVRRVFATPHFIANEDTPEKFFERRERSLASLSEILKREDLPSISVGAEVAYFSGLSRMSALPDMRLSGTKLLLVEMPIEQWSEYSVGELISISLSGCIIPMIAHIERCIDMQSAKVIKRLRESGVLMQSNASFFINKRSRHRAIKLFSKGIVSVLSSDCHNTISRPPRLGEAVEVIREKLGESAVFRMNSFAESLVQSAK